MEQPASVLNAYTMLQHKPVGIKEFQDQKQGVFINQRRWAFPFGVRA